MRKNVQIKLGKLSDSDYQLINTWLDHQKNNQESILNAIMHVIHQTGVENDVTSFESQKKLFNQQYLLIDTPKPYEATTTKQEIAYIEVEKSNNKSKLERNKEVNEDFDMTNFSAEDF